LTILSLTKVDVGMMEDVGTSANKLIQLDSNAKIPAVDGSLLTNMITVLSGSSDPTLSTNPSGGVGTKYKNTTDGEMFICTDATAGANVWTNVGAGSDNVAPWYMTSATTSYFTAGGGGPPFLASIDRNAFASDGDSTDWGDLTVARGANGNSSSTTHGYSYAGYSGANTNIIDKFAMVTASNATDVGDMTYSAHHAGGMTGPGYGYTAGGWSNQDQINKHPFASDGNATDVGDTRVSYQQRGGQSETYGYMMGGTTPNNSIISKIQFSNDSYSTSIGNLRGAAFVGATCTATGYVFALGGGQGTAFIDKMATSSDSDAVDTGGSLTQVVSTQAGGANSSSTGYVCGGGDVNVIQKFSLNISSGTSTDIGNLTIGRQNNNGHQY
jgi:hypothetical protein